MRPRRGQTLHLCACDVHDVARFISLVADYNERTGDTARDRCTRIIMSASQVHPAALAIGLRGRARKPVS